MVMLALPEPERDRWLWGAPTLSPEELRAFDPAGASTEEVVLAAVAALRLGWHRRAERFTRAAHARAPEDPTIRAILVYAGIVRRLSCCLPRWRPTDAEVSELWSLAERSAFARYALARALFWRGDRPGTRLVLEGCPREQREAPSVIAARGVLAALTEESAGEGLRQLREHRASWPAWRGLLNLELLTAFGLRDLHAVVDAYTERCRLLRRKPRTWIARAWVRGTRLQAFGFAAWGVALATGWLYGVPVAIAFILILEFANWHVADWRVRVMIDHLVTVLLGAGTTVASHLMGFWPRVLLGSAMGVMGIGGYLWVEWHLRRLRKRSGLVHRRSERVGGSSGRSSRRTP